MHPCAKITLKGKLRANLWQWNRQKYTEAFHVSVRHFSVDVSDCFRRDRREGGRGEKEKQWKRDWDEWPHLKAAQKYLHTFISEMCVRLMCSAVFLAWSEKCVSGMFHELELVLLQLQWRMPIYIPGVSFHYFYLHAALSLPDQSGFCAIQISFTAQVTQVNMLVFLLSMCFSPSCVSDNYTVFTFSELLQEKT